MLGSICFVACRGVGMFGSVCCIACRGSVFCGSCGKVLSVVDGNFGMTCFVRFGVVDCVWVMLLVWMVFGGWCSAGCVGVDCTGIVGSCGDVRGGCVSVGGGRVSGGGSRESGGIVCGFGSGRCGVVAGTR